MNNVIISTGDPAGCSPELILPLIEERKNERLIFVGPPALREYLPERLPDFEGPGASFNCWYEAGNIDPDQISSGDINSSSGAAALDSLKGALELSEKLDNCSLLTLPLSKSAVQASGEANFLGHTEFLENFWSAPGVMSFFGEKFNVALLTRHCPIDSVSSLLRPEKIIQTINTCRRFFERRFSPKFALLGLNPHSGEKGLLGGEETEILRPAVEQLRSEGLDITGPFPADSFLPISGGDVDMIFACYHDQGLVPFKQLHFFTGIQATLGLPIPRVSPDHGTAAKIAGTGQVDTRSAINCLKWLRRWWGAEE